MTSSDERPTLLRGLGQALLLGGVFGASLSCYMVVLKWRGPAASVTTWTPLDEWIPFSPTWVWVYLSPYFLGPILVGLMTRTMFWWYVHRCLAVVGVTLTIFVAFPTQTDNSHRARDVGDGPSAALYKQMIEMDDPPANAAPSLHVSLTCLLLLALLRNFRSWWPLWLTITGLICYSTLATRQHHLIDVGTGALMAWGVAVVCDRVQRRWALADSNSVRAAHGAQRSKRETRCH